jgi:hypothetical protein
MKFSYAQTLMNDLFDEGERDHHFFYELMGFVAIRYTAPFMAGRVNLNKSDTEQFEDALTLSRFMINSGAYVGFYMPAYGTPERTFESASDFENFLKRARDKDELFLSKLASEDRYTVGLMKVKDGAKAPDVTVEVERLFVLP